MTRAVLALCDGSSPASSHSATALALQLAAEGGLAAHVAFSGASTWEDHGWAAAWSIAADDGRGAARALTALLEKNTYAAVVGGDSALSREAMGRLAGRLGLPVAGRVLAAHFVDDSLEVVRGVEEGRRSAKYRMATLPALAMVDPEASFPTPPASKGRIEGDTVSVDYPPANCAFDERSVGPLEIGPHEADAVVAGGKGLGQDGFALAAELAAILRGAVGASRVAVDLGWAPRSCQVGMTGQIVQPRLYIAAGISGAIHHTFGMKDSSFIVAINSDPAAPIFQFADAAIVGDAKEVLAALIEVLKARSKGSDGHVPVLAGLAG